MKHLYETGEKNINWRGDAASKRTIHGWLLRHHPKTGSCEKCGRVGYTEHAFLHHPAPHTRNRDDYMELCKSCHELMDKGGKGNWHSGRTHCKRGHEFTPENTYVTTKGSRQCRACKKLTQRERARRAYGIADRPERWRV